jgi:hypothetical protein
MGFMEELTRRAREELEGLRRALAEARPPGVAEAATPVGVPVGEASVADATGAGAAAAMVIASRAEPTVWPLGLRQAFATLELPLGSGRREVAAAHARLVERFSLERFEDLPDGASRVASLRQRLDEAERRLVTWLDTQPGTERDRA